MWANDTVFYQLSTLGFCGAPLVNDGTEKSRINKVTEWTDYFKDLGIGAIYFCPVFKSESHGYNTIDFRQIDNRLGSNEDFKNMVGKLHEAGIKTVLDGVFHHVGREFWAFRDVRERKWDSAYKDWFNIDFSGNSNYNDGFYYEGWEGHYELVKLNLYNEDVVNYLTQSIGMWIDEFGIDGLRLDVAYSLPDHFLRRIREYALSKKEDFFIVGESLSDNYRMLLENMDSVTNYQCYKGIWSSLNSNNMFEIAHSVNRQQGELGAGCRLFNFVDNHDVNRIASTLNDENHFRHAFTLMFMLPGIPCIYYGSEWGVKGDKNQAGNDEVLRPSFETPSYNENAEFVKKLAEIFNAQRAARIGNYRQVYLTNNQLGFERNHEGESLFVLLNIKNEEHTASIKLPEDRDYEDLLTGDAVKNSGGIVMKPYEILILK